MMKEKEPAAPIRYSPVAVKRIRRINHMTQQALADYLWVSKKTVEAWECGTKKPSGPACKLMEQINHPSADFWEKEPITFHDDDFGIDGVWQKIDGCPTICFRCGEESYALPFDDPMPDKDELRYAVSAAGLLLARHYIDKKKRKERIDEWMKNYSS